MPAAPPLEDRAALAEKAENEARAAFESDHYTFTTPFGRVDPARGGLPYYCVDLYRWTLYRGGRALSESQALRRVGKLEDLKKVWWRKPAGLLMGLASAAAGITLAQNIEIGVDPMWQVAVGGVGLAGSLATAATGSVLYTRRGTSLDRLFFPYQKLNDKIRENYRAQYRVLYGLDPAPSATPGPVDPLEGASRPTYPPTREPGPSTAAGSVPPSEAPARPQQP